MADRRRNPPLAGVLLREGLTMEFQLVGDETYCIQLTPADARELAVVLLARAELLEPEVVPPVPPPAPAAGIN